MHHEHDHEHDHAETTEGIAGKRKCKEGKGAPKENGALLPAMRRSDGKPSKMGCCTKLVYQQRGKLDCFNRGKCVRTVRPRRPHVEKGCPEGQPFLTPLIHHTIIIRHHQTEPLRCLRRRLAFQP